MDNISSKIIEGFDGPYIDKYLKGYIPGNCIKKTKDIKEALKIANENKYCSGITCTRNGMYTLRCGTILLKSENKKEKEITWRKSKIDYSKKKILGFEGPFINKSFKEEAYGGGEIKFKYLDDAIEEAKKRKLCNAITLNRQNMFVLKYGSDLIESDINNKFKSNEITWIKKVIKKKSNIKNEYEIIKYKNKEYYFNKYTKICIPLDNRSKRMYLRYGKIN